MKRTLLASLFILACASWASAQALPELPPLDSPAPAGAGLPELPPVDASTSAPSAGLPDLPPVDGAPSAPAPSSGGLPDLPAVEGAPVLNPVPTTQAEPAGTKKADEGAGLPALPGELPAAPAEENKTAEGSAALPALPGEAPAGPSAAMPALPGEESSAATKTPVKTAKKPATGKKMPESFAPNTMFGGWVTPRGRSEILQLAWSSQEILNALIGNKYELLKEIGEYNPGGWREFMFQQAKTKRQVNVFVKVVGKRVWMRVGPPEPPAGVSYKETAQVRKDHEAALKILQKQFGKRFTRKGKTWEAPFDRPKS